MPDASSDLEPARFSPDTQSLSELLRMSFRIQNALKRRFDVAAQNVGLTYSRARVLLIVAREPGRSQADLAREVEVEAPTMKRLIDGLEESGFVRRVPVPGDRRTNGIYMTDKAGAEMGTILKFLDTLSSEIVMDIDHDELMTAIGVFETIGNRLRE